MNPLSPLARLSLRWQLFLIVFAGVMPVIALMLYGASRDRAHEVWEIKREAREAALDAAWRHEQLVRGGQELLVVLAQQREVTGGDAAACSALLARVLQQSSGYTMLGVADLSGDVFCSALPLSVPAITVSDRAYFQRAYSTKDFAVGTYVMGRASGKPTLPIAYPVTGASGAVQAVLFAGLDSGWLAEFATGSEVPFDVEISVMDRNGAVLAHYPEAHEAGQHDGMESVFRANVGQSGGGSASAKDHTGRDRYYAFVPLRWNAEEPLAFVGMSFPEEGAFADIDLALRRNIGGLVAVAVLALMAAWWVSRRLITGPTQKLVRAASRLAAGDLRERSGLPHGSGEMGQLAATFDDMAGALQARQAAVERLSHHNQTILDAAGEGICGVDPQGTVTFINVAGARMLGWEVQELIGKPAHQTWHHSRAGGTLSPPESCAILASVGEGAVLHGEDEVYWRQDGTGFPVEYTSSPIRDGRGQVTGAVVTFRDITERKQAEAELRQRYHELSALNQVSEVVAASLSLRVVAATALEAVLWVLELDAGVVRYLDPLTQELVALTDHGLPEGMVQQLRAAPRQPVSRGLAGAVAQTGEPLIVSDLPDDPRLVSDAMRTSGFLAYIGIPLKVQNEVVGVYSGFSRAHRTFTAAEIGLATSIGNVVGMAIANARLFNRVEAAGREWERTFDIMSEGVAILDPEFRIVRANQALAQLAGCSPEALVGELCYRVMHGVDSPVTGCPSVACVTEKRSCEMVRQEPYLGNRWLYLRSDPVLGPQGEPVSVVHTVQDITDLKRSEDELKRRYQELSALYQVSEVVTASLDLKVVATTALDAVLRVLDMDSGTIRYLDEATQELVLLADQGMPEEMVQEFHDRPRVALGLGLSGTVAQTGKPLIIEDILHDPRVAYESSRRAGFRVYLGLPVKVQSKVVGVISARSRRQRAFTPEDMQLVNSISEVVGMAIANARLFEQVEASLAEKEALLKEVHHRVKNNLQVISSLLDLQAGSVEDEGVLHLFREMQNRVRSMALIHEQLYRAPDLARIQFDVFARTLTSNLYRSWGVNSDVIELRVNVEYVLVPVDKAVPFGLIINELVSNALKHAFPDGRHGVVSIDFSLEHGRFSLVVRDNGVGVPADLSIEDARTLGLQLVNALTRQCRGVMEVHSDGGTEFRLTFPA
ncbi:MAG: GAF domain-containing protein [Chloroflexi bacterium]|nr:GAF domain-containing protein [Chloroflexota bacterium]